MRQPADKRATRNPATSGTAPELQLPATPFSASGRDLRPGSPLQLHLRDGNAVEGELVALDLAADRLTIRNKQRTQQQKIKLSDVDYLRFRSPLSPKNGDQDLARAVPFRIRFHSGEELRGRTLGALRSGYGLTLFENTGKQIYRLYIPATSIAQERIGERMGQAISRISKISEQDLESIARRQSGVASSSPYGGRGRLGELLRDHDKLSGDELARALANKLGLQYLEADELISEPAASKRLPASIAREYAALPLTVNDRRMRLATADPTNPQMINVIQFIVGRALEVVVASEEAILAKITEAYGDSLVVPSMDELEVGTPHTHEDESKEILEKLSNEKPVVRFVNSILVDAINKRVSDIHIRPTETSMEILYRIDGMLLKAHTVNKKLLAAIVSRIKIISGMDIAERRIPQDGRFEVHHQNKKVDLRISIMPTVDGESVVIRLLDTSASIKSIDQLGLSEKDIDRFNDLIGRSQGMFLVTGPTGSGKSTTLYAAIGAVREKPVNIMTVEDPVEYHMAGIEQIQVNRAVDLSFPRALRNILRHDPDVIMVGEIRDEETARIAMKSALTGHLVFSTLHTNSAVKTIARLIDMGIEAFLIQSTINGILAQRLMRRNCPVCAEKEIPSPREIQLLGLTGKTLPDFYRGKGCDKCNNTGYKGRMVTYELLYITAEVRKAINHGADEAELTRLGCEAGMVPLTEHAMQLAREGKTSLEEVLRVRLD